MQPGTLQESSSFPGFDPQFQHESQRISLRIVGAGLISGAPCDIVVVNEVAETVVVSWTCLGELALCLEPVSFARTFWQVTHVALLQERKCWAR